MSIHRIPVSLKWGKTSYDDGLFVQPGSSVEALKLEIQNRTGVPMNRQKLLCPKAWKGAWKDEEDVLPSDIQLPKGKKFLVVTLLGSAETLVEKPFKDRPRFEEDMTPEEIWKVKTDDDRQGGELEHHDVVDIPSLQKEPGMERDDGKMEMYSYNRLVNGLPQHQIDDMLASRRNKTTTTTTTTTTLEEEDGSNNPPNNAPNNVTDQSSTSSLLSSKPLWGEVAMTMGMELRRAYINSLAVLADGTIVSGLDDGHIQLWRRGQLLQDVRHPGNHVDIVTPFPSFYPTPSTNNHKEPSFLTAGDSNIGVWTLDGNLLFHMTGFHPGVTPASIAVSQIKGKGHDNEEEDEDNPHTAECFYFAACFRVTREVDPHQFRLVPQNEAERQRREVAEAQEREIQDELRRISTRVRVWCYDRNPTSHDGSDDGGGLHFRDDFSIDFGGAPITHLLSMEDGECVSGDSWGGIRLLGWNPSSPQEESSSSHNNHHHHPHNNHNHNHKLENYAFLQFRESSIASMESLKNNLLAVSIQPEQQDTGVYPSATSLVVTRPRAIYLIETKHTFTIQAVIDGHRDTVQCLCRVSDNILLSAGGKMDATVKVWDIPGEEDENTTAITTDDSEDVPVWTDAKTLKEPGYVFDLKVLPDSKGSGTYAIAAARYNVIKIVI